jgi:Domain of unknown function (DUF4386)
MLLGQVLARDGLAVVPTATVGGVLAAVVQYLGLARWPFLVPALARAYTDPASTQATREATKAAFDSFHRYLGPRTPDRVGTEDGEATPCAASRFEFARQRGIYSPRG